MSALGRHPAGADDPPPGQATSPAGGIRWWRDSGFLVAIVDEMEKGAACIAGAVHRGEFPNKKGPAERSSLGAPCEQQRIAQLPCWPGQVTVSPLSGGMTNHTTLPRDHPQRRRLPGAHRPRPARARRDALKRAGGGI
ncbi:MAG: hypothetical protein IPF71_16485 [Rhodoferax sp.]|nr:hypothetical protein [Rhodoferax sp.]